VWEKTGFPCSAREERERDLGQCSKMKSSMPFKLDLALQNISLKITLQNATPN
jgi:hypothetical protein